MYLRGCAILMLTLGTAGSVGRAGDVYALSETLRNPAAFRDSGAALPDEWGMPPVRLGFMHDDLAERMLLDAPPPPWMPAQTGGDFYDDREEGVFHPDGGYESSRQKSQRLGGLVEMSNRSGLDYDDLFISLKSRIEDYERFGDENSWKHRLRLALPFGADQQFGLFAYVSRQERNYGAEEAKAEWARGPHDAGAFLDEFEVRQRRIERQRTEYGLNLDWHPDDWTWAYARFVYLDSEDMERRQGLEYDVDRDGEGLDALYQSAGRMIEDGVVTAATLKPEEGRVERKLKDELETDDRYGLDAGFVHTFENGLTLNGTAQFARREKQEPDRLDTEYEYDLEEDGVPGFSYRLDGEGEPPDVTPAAPGSGIDVYDPAEYVLRKIEVEDNERIWDTRELGADLTMPTETTALPFELRFGAHHQRRYRKHDNEYERYEPNGPTQAAGYPLSDTLAEDAGDDVLGTPFGPTVDPEQARAIDLGDLDYQEWESRFRSVSEDYTGTEGVTSGFCTATFEGRTRPWRLLLGLREEWTDGEYTAHHVQWEGRETIPKPPFLGGDDDPVYSEERIQTERSEVDILPSIRFRYQPMSRLVLRAVWAHSLLRPEIRELAPLHAANADDGEEGELDLGNPDLEHDRIGHLELSGDLDLGGAGIVSAGIFHRRHSDPVFRHGALIDYAIPDPEVNNPDVYRTRTSLNADEGRETGFRVHLYRRFVEWPRALDGFGVLANYIYTDSEQDAVTLNGNRRTTRLAEQSDHVGNAGVFYERDHWFGYIIGEYRSNFLDSVGDTPDGTRETGDLWVDDRFEVDLYIEYQFTRELEIFFEVRNLTDEPYLLYEGDERRVIETVSEGRNYRAGLQAKF